MCSPEMTFVPFIRAVFPLLLRKRVFASLLATRRSFATLIPSQFQDIFQHRSDLHQAHRL